MNEAIIEPRLLTKVGEITEDKSYGAILQHIQSYPFVILSAYRREYNRRENRQRLRNMIKDFYNMTGIGGILLKGVGQEVDPETGELTEATEWSALFILRKNRKYKISNPSELLEIAKGLARKYNQNYFVFGDGSGIYYLYGREGLDYDIVEKWTDIKRGISVYYSRIKGVPFYFESAELYVYKKAISNIFEGMAFYYLSNIHDFG